MTTSSRSGVKSQDAMLGRIVAGRYKLETRIGEGGMGIVYRARHVLIDRVVALKLIRPDLRSETHLRAWMLREARAANRVDHAHIIDIHDIGETEEGELYLVMEYLIGTSLASELAKGPLHLSRGVDILEQMCAALARAHDLGVIHRDLKSDNILLTVKGGRKDYVKILDFGLAHLAMDPRLAPKGAVFGTPEYMSPEQARGEEAGPQSDLYALGVLFFEMLTGRLPFRSPDREALLEMQRTAPPPRPSSLRNDLRPEAEALTLRLLEKDRRMRFQDAHHLHEELKSLQRSLPNPNWEVSLFSSDNAPPPSPPAHESQRIETWGHRAGLFSRIVGRVYPSHQVPEEVAVALSRVWDLASKAMKLEGEIATHTRKVESLEKRGRALRAEIGRKVEELAHEESRILREVNVEQGELSRLRELISSAETQLKLANTQAEEIASKSPTSFSLLRSAFERVGAAKALAESRQVMRAEHELKAQTLTLQANDFRKQIDELRVQLTRYGEALEEDLAIGRDRVTSRSKEGLRCQKAFFENSHFLMNHFKNKSEARELLQELMNGSMEQSPGSGSDKQPSKSAGDSTSKLA